MKKKMKKNNFENDSNEKQNSLTSGIRIGLREFPVCKTEICEFKSVEYSTDMEFFIQIQLRAVVSNNECCSICSSVEKWGLYFNFGAIFECMP